MTAARPKPAPAPGPAATLATAQPATCRHIIGPTDGARTVICNRPLSLGTGAWICDQHRPVHYTREPRRVGVFLPKLGGR